MKVSKKKLFVAGGTLLCGVIAVVLYVSFFATNTGSIKPTQSEDLKEELMADKVLEGETMRFTHKGSFTPSKLPATDNDIEIYRVSAKSGQGSDFVVSVSELPTGELASSSAYIMRSTRTDMYAKRTVQYPAGAVDLFVNENQHEITAFIKRDNKVAVLSFIQAATLSDELMPEVDWVLRSFAWKQ